MVYWMLTLNVTNYCQFDTQLSMLFLQILNTERCYSVQLGLYILIGCSVRKPRALLFIVIIYLFIYLFIMTPKQHILVMQP